MTSDNRPKLPYYPQWRTTCLLCNAGLRDEALLYVVAEVPFSCPSDQEVLAVSETRVASCILALDENVLWCRIALPQAHRIVRLLRSGQLALCVHAFEPNSPQVLSGARARILSTDDASLAGIETARRQPPGGFKTPHRVRASLKLGPNADISEIRRAIAEVVSPRISCLPEHG